MTDKTALLREYTEDVPRIMLFPKILVRNSLESLTVGSRWLGEVSLLGDGTAQREYGYSRSPYRPESLVTVVVRELSPGKRIKLPYFKLERCVNLVILQFGKRQLREFSGLAVMGTGMPPRIWIRVDGGRNGSYPLSPRPGKPSHASRGSQTSKPARSQDHPVRVWCNKSVACESNERHASRPVHYIVSVRRTVTDIQRKPAKQGKRNVASRNFHSERDRETVAA